MTSQRVGSMYVPASDVHVIACFYAAAALTLISAGLVVTAVVLDWPAMPVNFCIALMLLTWLGAFERRRYIIERNRQDEHEIRELERWLWDR